MNSKERIRSQIRRSHSTKKKRKLSRPPRPIPPYRIERMYLLQLLTMRKKIKELLKVRLIPKLPHYWNEAHTFYGRKKNDDFTSEVFGSLKEIRVIYEKTYTDQMLGRIARNVFDETSELNKDNLKRTFKSVLGIDIFINDKNLENQAQGFVFDNVRLIKSTNAKYLTDIENIVLDGFKSGTRWEVIAAQIQSESKTEILKDSDGNQLLDDDGHEMYGKLSDWDAERIARDQVGKLNGQLEEQRQQALGVSQYIWRTSMDERVRPEHEILEDQTFDWDGPDESPEGAPSTPIMCRCWAEPILDDLLS